MPHELHGDTRRNACPRQHAAKRVAERVKIHDAAQIVADGNAAGFQIACSGSPTAGMASICSAMI
jgi:hypothetical protein